MINATTVNKLNEMRLPAMAETFRQQLQDPAFYPLSFEERFSLIVDIEWARRKNNRLTKLIRAADFQQSDACIENIEYHADRKLDKAQIARLSTCNYIQEKHNVIILGATGAGKSYIASALGMAANRNFYSVKYVRLPELLTELAISRLDGTYRKVMKQYKQVKLLILDEYLLFQLKETELAVVPVTVKLVGVVGASVSVEGALPPQTEFTNVGLSI